MRSQELRNRRSVLAMFALLAPLALLLAAQHSAVPSALSDPLLPYLDHVVRENPTSCSFANRAEHHLLMGRMQSALGDIREAIQRNPDDLGRNYRAASDRELTPDAIQHGEQQLRQMLTDRPEMARHVRPGDKLWTWTVRKFAGEDTGQLIYWDANEPGPFRACCYADRTRLRISIRSKEQRHDLAESHTFDELWSCAAFELQNLIPLDRWDEMHAKAQTGAISRDEYVEGVLKIEELAMQRTRAFYLKYYLPWLLNSESPNSIASSPASWHVLEFYADDNDRRDVWKSWTHWPCYSAWYDLCRVRDAFARRDVSALEELLKHVPPIADVGADIVSQYHYWRGYLRLNQSRFSDAFDEFDRAQLLITSGHTAWPDTLLGRANALSNLERYEEAARDLQEIFESPIAGGDVRYDALVYLAHMDEQRDLRSEALGHLNRAIELAPNRIEAYQQRSYIHALNGNHTDAVADLSEILRINPQDTTALIERSRANYEQKLWPAALADVNAALAIEPDNAEMVAHRGWIYFDQEKFELAAKDFARALELDGELTTALVGRGSVTARWEDHPDPNLEHAFEDVFRACEHLEWQDAWTIQVLAYICEARGNKKLADEYRQKAEQLSRPAAEQSTEPSLPSSSDGAGRTQTPLAISC